MNEGFNKEEAKNHLLAREAEEKNRQEDERKRLLEKTIQVLKGEFHHSKTEAYLVGSIIQPFSFSSSSDIDIVLRNFKGDRFDLWTKLEDKIGRAVEIILFETCHFQEYVLKDGVRVL